jgi:hypothetical protein
VAVELQKELGTYENSMLVLGTSSPESLPWNWIAELLEGTPQRGLLIVNSARAAPAPEA